MLSGIYMQKGGGGVYLKMPRSCRQRCCAVWLSARALRWLGESACDACTAASRWPRRTPACTSSCGMRDSGTGEPMRAGTRSRLLRVIQQADQVRAAAGQHAARAQRLEHAALAQIVAQHGEEFAGARLQDLRQEALPHQPRRRLPASRAGCRRPRSPPACGTLVTTQLPYSRFSCSASSTDTCRPTARSLVKWSPPIGSTAVCAIEPSKKTASSVVLAPISAMQTPSSRSSADSTASAEAMPS